MAAKIGIIGKGNVDGALQRGLARAGHDVRAVGKDPAKADGLRANGADDVIIDTGRIAEDVRQRVPPGVDTDREGL